MAVATCKGLDSVCCESLLIQLLGALLELFFARRLAQVVSHDWAKVRLVIVDRGDLALILCVGALSKIFRDS